MKTIKYMLMLIFILCLACQEPEEILIQEDIPSLKEVFQDDFYIGAAIEPFQLEIPAHRQLLKKHFSSITAENAMKPESIQPEEGKFDFGDADKLARFAGDNGIALRGHTLVWHQQVPAWFFSENGAPASKEKLKERMRTHITQVMQRYKGQIYAWDVVNEAIDPGEKDGFRRNKWYEILGEEYIELAFRYAKEADPEAKLFLNDYGTTDANRRELIIKLIQKLKAKGVSIDGVGMQMHVSLTKPNIYDFESALKDFSEQDLEIQITELDVTVYENKEQSFSKVSQELLNEQGHRVKDLFAVINKYKEHITSITFWGMTDDHTWLTSYPVKRSDWPLPFDKEQKAKPFYWGLADPRQLTPRINKAKAIEGTAVIDGKAEDIWQFAESFPRMTISDESGAEIKALWDKQYLYILLKVADATPLQEDAITIFLDEKNNKADALDENDRLIEFALDKTWKNTKDTALTKSASGYVFEARIPFAHIKGSKIITMGLDILIKNGEQGVLKWNDKDTVDSKTPKYWGALKFVTAPSGTTAPFGTAKIDGIKDAKYNAGKPLIVSKFIQGIEGEENVQKGATANVWVLWDEQALYVYAEVNDSRLSVVSDLVYMQDSIEVFIDENNNKSPFYEKDDGQFRVNYNNEQSFGSTGPVEGFESAAKKMSGGYVVEVKIPYRSLTPKPGTIIGFDFQVNDDQGSGKRDSISKWNDPTNDSWQSTAGFGVLIFKK
ncbi:MAG: endo-1,4-beta-xylanase [Spirochaetales bacterium]|nr:endo-1,4-beta-xylanase [Spirochaetales bacterium]